MPARLYGYVGEVFCWEHTPTTKEDRVPELWAGTDAGKAEHHCTVIDADGETSLSRRVPNSEAELLELLGDVLSAYGLSSPAVYR